MQSTMAWLRIVGSEEDGLDTYCKTWYHARKRCGEMVTHMELIVSIVVAMFASTGFWSLLTYLIQRRDSKNSAESQMLKGLAHDRICYLGERYIKQGYVTQDQFQNLHDYLYEPYTRLGGNGTAKKIMDEVRDLPLKENVS